MLIYKPGMETRTVHSGELALFFHALPDEAPPSSLRLLQGDEQRVCQSRLSFHLLKEASLVNDRPEGPWICDSLNRVGLDGLGKFVADLKNPVPGSAPSQCCQLFFLSLSNQKILMREVGSVPHSYLFI